MIVAINAGFHSIEDNEYKDFIYQCFSRIVRDHPEHTYIFIWDKSPVPFNIISSNVIAIPVKSRFLIFKKLLLKKKITAVLKKYKADVFLTNPEIIVKTKAAQSLIVSSLLCSKKYLSLVKAICTGSEFLKKNITDNYKVDPEIITVIYSGIDEKFQPVNFEEKEIIKEKYADGKEYFLVHDFTYKKEKFVLILKAFSLFKKRQKSSMKLLLIVKNLSNYNDLIENLRLYKYKNEVKILTSLAAKELVNIIASSYAIISPFYPAEKYLPVIETIECGVPVITNSADAIQETCADAVLYVSPINETEIADKMMLLFKDEKLRQQKIERGKHQIENYRWNNAAALLWETILKTIS